jgi:transcriptional regulator with XRE-family HTH domain
MDTGAIGQALNALRHKKQVGLRQLARMAGVSSASLVTIEKGATSPTLATLNKILKALGTNFNEFFSSHPANPQVPVFNADSMRRLSDAHREYVLLFPKRSGMRFEIILESIRPNEKKSEVEVHDFDIGGFILTGTGGILEIGGVGKWKLAKGDAYYVPAGLKHRLINSGKKILKQITVVSPPKY